MTFKKILFSVATATALFAAPASAQQFFIPTDNSPIGGPGAGFSGSIANYGGSITSVFLSALGGNGASAYNPAGGGSVTVSPEVTRAIAEIIAGSTSAPAVATATTAFGGTPQAGALVRALQALGGAPTPASASAAIAAYNQAVDALPSGQTPSPGLLLARTLLAGFTS